MYYGLFRLEDLRLYAWRILLCALGLVTGSYQPSGSVQSVELVGYIVVRSEAQRWLPDPSRNIHAALQNLDAFSPRVCLCKVGLT